MKQKEAEEKNAKDAKLLSGGDNICDTLDQQVDKMRGTT
jgi:hypothetical protein